ncbi:hypothetical protein ES703_55835 [subsurface metagenome]
MFPSTRQNVFSVLSENDITKIHYATLNVLKNTDSIVLHKEAIDLLKKTGYNVEGKIDRDLII